MICQIHKALRLPRWIQRGTGIYIFVFLIGFALELFASEQVAPADPLLESARSGDVSSQLKLADQYFFGRNKRRVDLHLAAYWFRRAAEKNEPQAQFNYGVCCLNGWGVPKSPQTGYLWISRAAAQQLEKAQVMQAELLYSGLEAEPDPQYRFPSMSADPEKALSTLRKLFERGSVHAASTIAKLLMGDTKRRVQNSFELRRAAAYAAKHSPGNIENVLLYATVLQNGIGGPTDTVEAVRLLKSIENSSPEAMARLAEIYEYGTGTAPDPHKAFELCRRAARAGSPRAMVQLGTRYLEANMVPHDPVMAFKLFSEAWKQTYPRAASALGNCHLHGIGTPRDPAKAVELFMQGANLGDPESQYQLGFCFRYGRGTPRDPSGAVHWFKASAATGHPDAIRELGICLVRGIGTASDPSAGLQLLREAVRKGDVQAAEFLSGEIR